MGLFLGLPLILVFGLRITLTFQSRDGSCNCLFSLCSMILLLMIWATLHLFATSLYCYRPRSEARERLCFYRRVSLILFNGREGELRNTKGLWTTPPPSPRTRSQHLPPLGPGHNTSPPPSGHTSLPPWDYASGGWYTSY